MQGFSILMIFGAFFGLAIADVPDIGYQLDRCHGKHGVFLPVIGHCNQYLTCVQGEAIISSCGDYHFNARLAVCDLPANAGCISFGPLPIEPVEKPAPKLVESLCVGITNGVFLPVAENSRQYYLCMNNKSFLKDCGKLYFNTKDSACAPFPDDDTTIKEKIRPLQKFENSVLLPPQKLPGQYAALDGGIPIKEGAIPPQKFENSVLLPPQKLPGQYAALDGGIPIKEGAIPPQKFENSVLLPPQKLPGQYATLDGGIPIKEGAIPPQKFENSVLLPPQKLPGQYATLDGGMEQPAPKPVESPCVGIANGVFLPVAVNSKQYYLCMNNKSFLKDCGKLYFNTKYAVCAPFPDDDTPIKEKIRPLQKFENSVLIPPQKLPGQYATLDGGIPIKELAVPPQKIEISIIQPQQEFENSVALPPQELPGQRDILAQELCQNQQFGARVAVRDSCNQYYICLGKTAIPKSCGQMQFNPLTRICDLSTNVHCHIENYKAVYHETEQLMRPSSQNSTSINTSVCHGQRDGIFLAVPGKCSEFYICFKNQAFLKTCGLRHFSPIILSCVEVEKSNCVEFRQPPQTEEQSKSKQGAEALDASCLNRDTGILLRHPLDCGKFVMCDNHVAVEMSCPAGLHFNTEKDYCDWPEMAKCFLNN